MRDTFRGGCEMGEYCIAMKEEGCFLLSLIAPRNYRWARSTTCTDEFENICSVGFFARGGYITSCNHLLDVVGNEWSGQMFDKCDWGQWKKLRLCIEEIMLLYRDKIEPRRTRYDDACCICSASLHLSIYRGGTWIVLWIVSDVILMPMGRVCDKLLMW